MYSKHCPVDNDHKNYVHLYFRNYVQSNSPDSKKLWYSRIRGRNERCTRKRLKVPSCKDFPLYQDKYWYWHSHWPSYDLQSLGTLTLTLCQALWMSPLRFQIPSIESGCALCEVSTALQTSSSCFPRMCFGMGSVASQMVQAHSRCSGCFSFSRSAHCNVFPPSIDTSTRMIPRPPPLHAYPLNVTSSLSFSVVPGLGSHMALCIGYSCIATDLL